MEIMHHGIHDDNDGVKTERILQSETTQISSNGKQSISNNNNTTSEEHHKLSLLRTFVQFRDPFSKEVDDLTLRRFLRARDLDVEKAGGMFLKYLKWRRTFVPNGTISPDEIQYDLSHNKMFLSGVDKLGRPINVILGCKHFQNPNPAGFDEFKRFCVYSLDKICSRIPAGQESYLGIADLQGWGYANSDVRAYIGVLSLLQESYPERLGKMLIVHAPRLFMTVWKMVCPFVDEKTKNKIVFVENKHMKSTLLEHIDENQLPEIFGGRMPLVPIQDA